MLFSTKEEEVGTFGEMLASIVTLIDQIFSQVLY